MDCEQSCPLPDKIQEPQKSLNVAGIEIVTMSSAILFCFIMSTFTGFVCFKGISYNLSAYYYLYNTFVYYMYELLFLCQNKHNALFYSCQ